MERLLFPKRCLLPFRILVSILFVFSSAHAKGLSPEEAKLSAWATDHLNDATRLLEASVNINSGTMNFDGVRAVGKVFEDECNGIGLTTRWIELPKQVNRAGHLFAHHKGGKGKRILLIGHLDTVFEKESLFQKYVKKGNKTFGPGVADMKAGDVIILYALKALQSLDLLKEINVTVAFMGDEEKPGNPLSVARRDLIEAAKKSDVALAYEGAKHGLDEIATARRGFSEWELKVTGRQGHSSQIFSEKAGEGAIFEAARILNAFATQLKGEKYLTFNPGIILGGTEMKYNADSSSGTAFGKNNVIAKTAISTGDLRTLSDDQRERTKKKMLQIVSQHLPQTSADLKFRDQYPSMSPTEGNKELLNRYSDVSVDLGQGTVTAQDPSERGAADASFVAPYIPVIDGLGGSGDGEHSEKEYLELDTLVPQIQRTAILIYRLTR